MTNLLDFQRLSTYVGAVVDQKMVALTMGLTGSMGYLNTLIGQSQGYAQESLLRATQAGESATEATTASTTALIVLNQFTSTYLGLSATDPARSSQGNAVNVGAFYVRQADGRLRYVTGINGSGDPVYADATVTADPTSLAAAGVGVFLSLNTTSQQTVKGPTNFQTTLTGPRITAWTSQQLVTAIDVNDRIATVQNAITTADNRAIAAEAVLNNGKVAKIGDTMSGQLTIVATGENPSLTIRNSTGGSGRTHRFHSTDAGTLRIIDDTAQAERVVISPNGDVTIGASLSVGNNIVTKNVFANGSGIDDTGYTIQKNGVNRWFLRRADSAGRLYIARFNASGALIDQPLYIAESDGTVYTNRLVVNSTINAVGSLAVTGIGAGINLDNTSTAADAAVIYRHNGVARWSAGRDPRAGAFYLNRLDASGNYVDTPLQINEANGWATIRNLQVASVMQASTSVAAPILYAQANGTGRAVAIGDDVWLGDNNIPNGFSVRGQADFNAGFVRFGNAGLSLGCNANDGTLFYGANTVYHSGNFAVTPDSLGFSHGTTNGIEWSIRPAGGGKRYVVMSGSMIFNGEYAPQFNDYPIILEKVKAYHSATVIANGGLDYDEMGQFVGVPTNSRVTMVLQEFSGNERYPVTVTWVVEGIIT